MHSLKILLIAALLLVAALFALACASASKTSDNSDGAQPKPNANTAVAARAGANSNTPNTDARADELAGARQVYGERCTKCHGANADGGRVEFDNVKLKVPGLREGHARTRTDQQLARRISNGGEGMPAFNDKLKPEEIDALVRLIRQDFQGQAAAANAPAAPQSR